MEPEQDCSFTYSHKLRLLVGVAHVLDDGRQEERERVQWGIDTNGDKHYRQLAKQ